MIKHIVLIVMMIAGVMLPLGAQAQDRDCVIDLDPINALLADATDQLDAGNTDDALALIAVAEADLEMILAACTDKDVTADTVTPDDFDFATLQLDETAILRRALPGGDVLLRYPAGWVQTIGDGVVIVANDAAAITAEEPQPADIVGVMTALTRDGIAAYGLDADFSPADAVEVLALAFVGAYDEATLGSAETVDAVNGAVLAGTVIEDTLTAQIAFALVPAGEGYAFLVLTAFDPSVAAADLMTRLAETVEFLPDDG